MYPMLLLWGVQDRCTAAIVSEISKLVAMLSSLEEVEQVLSTVGDRWTTKPFGRSPIVSPRVPGPPSVWGP